MFKKIVVALALVASNAFMAPVNSVRSVRVSMREIGVREVVRLPPALFYPPAAGRCPRPCTAARPARRGGRGRRAPPAAHIRAFRFAGPRTSRLS